MAESGSNRKGGDFSNLEYLLVNLGRNQAAAERLIHLFLESAPTLCLRLERAAAQGDLQALKDVLHDIRSSCVLFSGNRCLDQAREIEDLVRERLIESSAGQAAVAWSELVAPLILCVQSMAVELKNALADGEG